MTRQDVKSLRLLPGALRTICGTAISSPEDDDDAVRDDDDAVKLEELSVLQTVRCKRLERELSPWDTARTGGEKLEERDFEGGVIDVDDEERAGVARSGSLDPGRMEFVRLRPNDGVGNVTCGDDVEEAVRRGSTRTPTLEPELIEVLLFSLREGVGGVGNVVSSLVALDDADRLGSARVAIFDLECVELVRSIVDEGDSFG